MPKSKANVDIIAAAEAVYAILAENNIKACAIGSMAIAYTTKIGRDPDSLDFATFEKGHNQRHLNDLLITSHPTSFVIENQPAGNSHLPPLIFYTPQHSSEKIRVFFLPLWTRHSQETTPPLDYSEVDEPKDPHTVPLAPLPFLIYLQLHGWAWNNSTVRQNPRATNKRANMKRDNFANDLGYLLPLAAKRRAKFDGLRDEFKDLLKDRANDFVQEHPALCKDWARMGVSGLEVKTAQPTKRQPAGGKGEGKSNRGEGGSKGKTRIIKDQLGLMEFEDEYPGGLDFND